MVRFENHAYYIHEKVFTNGYSFMLLEYRDENGLKSYRMDWNRENGPETPQKAYLTMEDSEKNRYIEFLILQKEERDRTIADKDAFIKNLQNTLDILKSMHESDSRKIDEMLAKINDLTAQLKLKDKQTIADKSQKGISKKDKADSASKPKDRDRDEEREGFDDTNCEKPSDGIGKRCHRKL